MEIDHKLRCRWVPVNDEIYTRYHDTEWGVPVHNDQKLFEMLILESFQAGLSWKTILRKRENFRKAFENFEVERVAEFSQANINSLLSNSEIIRNKHKIEAAIINARVYLTIQAKFGSFSEFIWRFCDGKPIVNYHRRNQPLASKTPLSTTISKELQHLGMTFVGPTIIYSYMQAIGMVNDHEVECFRFSELQ